MAKKAANVINLTVNSVALEPYISSTSLDVTQELPDTTMFSDAGPRRVAANYDWSISADGADDFASGAFDATVFGLLGNAGVASGFDPTGATAAANDPNYDGTVVLDSYSIKGSTGQAVQHTTKFQGTSALTRAVA